MSNQEVNTKFEFHSFGCKVNTYDTGLLEKRLHDFKSQNQDQSRVHVINSCAVTKEASLEALKRARQIKKNDQDSVVVLTGCSAQVDSALVDVAQEVDLVIANSHKTQIRDIISSFLNLKPVNTQNQPIVYRSNIFRKDDLEPGGGVESGHTRAFLKVQDGCNSFCSYCVIPFARGKSRSLSVSAIVERIHQLHEAQYQEVVITGIHIGDYECPETKKDFVGLIEEVLKQTSIPRIRLSSLEPLELSEALLDLYSDDRLCKHFHMSIQSAENKVLTDMKRHYQASDVEKSLELIAKKVPNSYVGMDVIVGFPTETHESFEETYMRLQRTPWTKLHVFPYSERTGTKAAQWTEQIPVRERKLRSERLRLLSDERVAQMSIKQLGEIKKCLVLNRPARGSNSLSRDFYSVQIMTPNNETLLAGSEYTVKVHSIQNRPGREPVLIAGLV